jgi:hypothetical protein
MPAVPAKAGQAPTAATKTKVTHYPILGQRKRFDASNLKAKSLYAALRVSLLGISPEENSRFPPAVDSAQFQISVTCFDVNQERCSRTDPAETG